MNLQQSNAPEEPLLTSRIIHKNSNEHVNGWHILQCSEYDLERHEDSAECA
jgi:hypothetical protein